MATSLAPKPDAARVKEVDPVERPWLSPTGVVGWFATIQNGPIGQRYIATAFFFFLVGGVLALLMRVQLYRPENTFLSPETYNELMTMHGSTMMYLFAVPMVEGIAVLLLPQIVGARDFPFPRLTAFGYWCFLFGGLTMYAGFLVDAVANNGWFSYVPLSNKEYSPGLGMDFWLLGLGLAEIAAIGGAIEMVVAILICRAPGMSLNRIPLFVWAMLVTSFMILFGFTPLLIGDTYLELDRAIRTRFFDPDAGGKPLLWQHLFWLFGHPEVYIMFLPASGIISMILPVFSRRPIVGYTFLALALVSTGFISFGLWVHHMFAVGIPQVAMSFFSAASLTISIPAGVQIFAWITTVGSGRPVFKTPFLFALGFLVLFVVGGVTGVMVGVVPFDWQVHDSYFVVAHFHYVLIGGVVFPVFAAFYYWTPKFTGRLLNETLGKWNFWLVFIGFNVTFFPMHITGLWGMPRRVYTYNEGLGWDALNLISTLGAFLLAAGFGLFIVNFLWSWWYGEQIGKNPWNADTLEWSLDSPPTPIAFSRLPIVRSRHPLWDQDNLETGNEREMLTTEVLTRWPTEWRSQLVTTVLDAEIQHIFRVATYSLWPFVAAVGLWIATGATIFHLYWLMGLGGLIVLIAFVGWNWPTKEEREGVDVPEELKRAGVEVYVAGSPIVAWWAMIMSIAVLGVTLASVVFTYFFLRLTAPRWPLDGIPLPELLLPSIGTGLLLVAALITAGGDYGARQGRIGWVKVGFPFAFLIAVGAIVLFAYDLSLTPFSWETNAYGSIFYFMLWFLYGMVGSGLLMSLFVQFWAWKGHYTARHHQAVSNTALYWYFIAATGIATYLTLYISPYIQ